MSNIIPEIQRCTHTTERPATCWPYSLQITTSKDTSTLQPLCLQSKSHHYFIKDYSEGKQANGDSSFAQKGSEMPKFKLEVFSVLPGHLCFPKPSFSRTTSKQVPWLEIASFRSNFPRLLARRAKQIENSCPVKVFMNSFLHSLAQMLLIRGRTYVQSTLLVKCRSSQHYRELGSIINGFIYFKNAMVQLHWQPKGHLHALKANKPERLKCGTSQVL